MMVEEPLVPTVWADESQILRESLRHARAPYGEAPHLVLGSRVLVTVGWLRAHVVPNWSAVAASSWLFANKKSVRRKSVRAKLSYYDLADVIERIVAGKAQIRAKLRPSVLRVLQGSGSINDKLLAFVKEGAQ